ncbi:MAG TPA: hypothetical protein PLE69_07395 [bacterium]|nr:hypothetical protein [bacterium]
MKTTKNAESYGFSPQADADTNVAALQSALNGGGIIVIDTPGVYNLNNTVFLDSNTLLICAPGVIFRKVAPYCNVLINRGALTKEYNENIIIDGLEISVNNQEAPPILVYGLRAQMGFFYVKNLTIRNFTCIDGKEWEYLIYIVKWEHLLIDNVCLAGDKDGIKLNNGHDAIIRNLDLTTYDDGTSLCGTDYPSTCVEVGDVYNVRYSNVTDHQYKNIFGRTCLIYTGSWADYRKGNEYCTGDFCLNEGNLYQCVNDAGFSAIASDPPVHKGGIVTGSDGISWRFMQPCDFYQTNVYNISFDNCTFEKSGNIIANWTVPDWYYKKLLKPIVHRPFYPGTEKNSNSWGISITNCKITGKGPQILVNIMGNMKDISINNCFFNNPQCTLVNVDKDSPNEALSVLINGCMFPETYGSLNAFNKDKGSLPDHQNCPILREDIEDAGKFLVVHNGNNVNCTASGNSYNGSGVECKISNNAKLRFSFMDICLRNLQVLTPVVGDICRGSDGLYLYTSSGWRNFYK